jgi:hypothetical protein
MVTAMRGSAGSEIIEANIAVMNQEQRRRRHFRLGNAAIEFNEALRPYQALAFAFALVLGCSVSSALRDW